MYELTVISYFSAAHFLRNFDGRCEDLHGHNWRVEITIAGSELNHADLLIDFSKVKKIVNTVLYSLDHKYLNDLFPFDRVNPSSEMIARYFFEEINCIIPAGIVLIKVSIWESETSYVSYLGEKK